MSDSLVSVYGRTADEIQVGVLQIVPILILFAFCGIYFWEFFISLRFEWSFIIKRKKFNWPMIPYFAGRYTCLAVLITALAMIYATLTSSTVLRCGTTFFFPIPFGTQVIITFASANLAIRTMIVWGMSLYIVVPLVVLLLGQWGLFILSEVLDAPLVSTSGYVPPSFCGETPILPIINAATFIYSLGFDSIVFFLSAWKLASPRRRVSQAVNLLFKDGLVYFVLMGIVNLLAIIISSCSKNPFVIASSNIPVPVISTIIASRAVRRLSNFSTTQPATYLLTQDRLIFQSASTPTPGPNLNLRVVSPAVPEVRSPAVTFHIDTLITGGDDAEAQQVDEKTGTVTTKVNSDSLQLS